MMEMCGFGDRKHFAMTLRDKVILRRPQLKTSSERFSLTSEALVFHDTLLKINLRQPEPRPDS